MDSAVETQIQELKKLGLKVTTARRAILEVLIEGPSHQSAEDITERISGMYPEIHMSTVYRTLDTLEEFGIIDHVHLGHGRAVYHLGDDPHQHLVCEKCGKVTEVPNAIFSTLEKILVDSYEFNMRQNHFAVLGKCIACSS